MVALKHRIKYDAPKFVPSPDLVAAMAEEPLQKLAALAEVSLLLGREQRVCVGGR